MQTQRGGEAAQEVHSVDKDNFKHLFNYHLHSAILEILFIHTHTHTFLTVIQWQIKKQEVR